MIGNAAMVNIIEAIEALSTLEGRVILSPDLHSRAIRASTLVEQAKDATDLQIRSDALVGAERVLIVLIGKVARKSDRHVAVAALVEVVAARAFTVAQQYEAQRRLADKVLQHPDLQGASPLVESND